MRVVTPHLSRKPLGQGFVLVVPRDLADPFAPGDTIADAKHRDRVVSVEAAERPREVRLLVEVVTPT